MTDTEGHFLKRRGLIRSLLLVIFLALRCIVAHDFCVEKVSTMFTDNDDWFWMEMKRLVVIIVVLLWVFVIVLEDHWFQDCVRVVVLSLWVALHVLGPNPLWSTPDSFWKARENLRGFHGMMMFTGVP